MHQQLSHRITFRVDTHTAVRVVRYIRTGNYARILNAMSMGAGDPGHPGVYAKKVQKLKDLGTCQLALSSGLSVCATG